MARFLFGEGAWCFFILLDSDDRSVSFLLSNILRVYSKLPMSCWQNNRNKHRLHGSLQYLSAKYVHSCLSSTSIFYNPYDRNASHSQSNHFSYKSLSCCWILSTKQIEDGGWCWSVSPTNSLSASSSVAFDLISRDILLIFLLNNHHPLSDG